MAVHHRNSVSRISLAAFAVWGCASAAAAQTAAEASDAGGIEEIVVTAQKRGQSGQDVPITLSVVSGDALAKRGATSVTDLTGMVPNVQANYGAGQVAFNVRGIGTNEFSANLDSPVALNLDEVYLSKTFMSGLLLFDIDRVEALKGPQGTLFGRNATGGAINFFTRRPTADLSAGGTVSYDNYQTVRTEAYLSGPLSDTISARVSGMWVDQGKGWYRNTTLGRREASEKKWALRGQLQWKGDSTTALLTVSSGRQNGTLIPYEGVGAYTPASLAAGAPVLCAEYLAGRANGASANCVRGTSGGYPGDNNPFTSTNNHLHTVHNKSFGTNLRIEHDLGSSTLTSITSYQTFTRDQHEDSDGSPNDGLDADYFNRVRQLDQELRLSSNGDGPWSYVAGLFYEHSNYRNGDYLEIGTNAATGLWSPFTQKSDALAAFFHNNVKLTDTLSLTAGVRYSTEKVSFNGGTYLGTGISGSPERPTTVTAPLAVASKHRTDNSPNFKLGLEWRPTMESGPFDKLMIYGNVSTGFRSGSFNGEFTTSPAELTSLAPEKIAAYELGFKSSLADRTMQLNGSVFHYDFTDGFINVDSPGTIIPLTINAANIKTWGAELDWVWAPVRSLNIGLSGGWLSSHIRGNISSGGQSLDGNRSVQSPRWTFTGQFSWTPEISSGLKAIVSGDTSWRSSQYFETSNSPMSLESGYWLVNGRLGVGAADDKWTLTAFAKNLTKTKYRTYVNDLGPGFGVVINIYGAPRTYGLSASVKF